MGTPGGTACSNGGQAGPRRKKPQRWSQGRAHVLKGGAAGFGEMCSSGEQGRASTKRVVWCDGATKRGSRRLHWARPAHRPAGRAPTQQGPQTAGSRGESGASALSAGVKALSVGARGGAASGAALLLALHGGQALRLGGNGMERDANGSCLRGAGPRGRRGLPASTAHTTSNGTSTPDA